MGDGPIQEQHKVSLSSSSRSPDRAERWPSAVRARSEFPPPQTRLRASLVHPRGRILMRWYDLRPGNICLHARPALRTRDDDEDRRHRCLSPISGSYDPCASDLRWSYELEEARGPGGI